MESVCLWNLQMKCTYINSTIRHQTSQSWQNALVWESTWINTSWLSGFVYVCRCFCVLHSLSQSAQFTEVHIQTLNFLSFISGLMRFIELTLCSGCGHWIHQHLTTLDKHFPVCRVLKHTKFSSYVLLWHLLCTVSRAEFHQHMSSLMFILYCIILFLDWIMFRLTLMSMWWTDAT